MATKTRERQLEDQKREKRTRRLKTLLRKVEALKRDCGIDIFIYAEFQDEICTHRTKSDPSWPRPEIVTLLKVGRECL